MYLGFVVLGVCSEIPWRVQKLKIMQIEVQYAKCNKSQTSKQTAMMRMRMMTRLGASRVNEDGHANGDKDEDEDADEDEDEDEDEACANTLCRLTARILRLPESQQTARQWTFDPFQKPRQRQRLKGWALNDVRDLGEETSRYAVE